MNGAYWSAAQRRQCCDNGCESIGPDYRELHRRWFFVTLAIAAELRVQRRLSEAKLLVLSARRCYVNASRLPI